MSVAHPPLQGNAVDAAPDRPMIRAVAIVLIGLRGSGKTTVGRLLARRMRWPFADTDARLATAAGRTIAEIFAAEGETGFRRRESSALAEVLEEGGGRSVVATGGGAVLAPGNRELMLGHAVVYLRADADTLAARVAADPTSAASRPALTDAPNPAEEVRRLLAEREPVYRSVATLEIDAARRRPESVVREVMRALDVKPSRHRTA